MLIYLGNVYKTIILKMNKISCIINKICRNLGINYSSKFLEDNYNNSIEKLMGYQKFLKML